MSLVVLVGEGASRGAGRRRPYRAGRPAGRCPQAPRTRAASRSWRLRAAGPRRLGVPVASCIYWIFEGGAHAHRGRFARLGGALHRRLQPVGRPGRHGDGPARSLCWWSAIPVVCTSSWSGRPSSSSPCPGWSSRSPSPTSRPSTPTASAYQTAPLLVLAYAIMFFPLALVCVRASVAQSPVVSRGGGGLARGAPPALRLLRVTLPLVAPGLGAASCLVFLSAVTELTATLDLDTDQRRDAGHTVLGLPAEPLLWPGGPVRPRHHRHRGRPELRPRPLLRPAPPPRAGRPRQRCRDVTDLEVDGLHKSYGAQPVLRGLDLAVVAGSFTSILGPSGSGKTTLLRVIAGFERADRGVVRLGAESSTTPSTTWRPTGAASASCPRTEACSRTSRSSRTSASACRGVSGMARGSPSCSRWSGLSGLERRYPHQLSGGQQQRVALARALAIEPSLVLLDEPFASLDASLRAALRQDVRRVLKTAGATALLVTHDQDEALSLADRVAVLRDGRIGQYDTPQELYARPSNPELARGLGETNFLRGTARGSGVETPLGLPWRSSSVRGRCRRPSRGLRCSCSSVPNRSCSRDRASGDGPAARVLERRVLRPRCGRQAPSASGTARRVSSRVPRRRARCPRPGTRGRACRSEGGSCWAEPESRRATPRLKGGAQVGGLES